MGLTGRADRVADGACVLPIVSTLYWADGQHSVRFTEGGSVARRQRLATLRPRSGDDGALSVTG